MTQATGHPTATGGPRVLQRVVLPFDQGVDVLPLYVEGKIPRHAATSAAPAPGAGEADAPSGGGAEDAASSVRYEGDTHDGGSREGGDAANRRSAVVRARQRVSFGTYFNAFPASYWRRWTIVDEVLLRVRIRGDATVVVYRSTAKGNNFSIESERVNSPEARDLEFTLSLKPFIDGGWYWFDILAGDEDATLETADWAAVTDRLKPGRLSIGITTFNRPGFCVEQLRNLGRAADVLDVVDEIFIVDQGADRVEEHPDFPEASKGVADRLRVIDQGNLGGSGGFSRAMDETVAAGDSDYVLLLDDDVVTETEGILRAGTFADLAGHPTVVGGHMFSLYNRSVLHAFGETVAKYRWWWGPAAHTEHGHDLARRSLRQTPWLHRRIDVDYNGWWMCLIPTQIVREVGLALPVFIKWDDAEYGLRAQEAGYPVVSMPGVAVWHVTWDDKDDAIDWQAYFHERNRLLSALLHSPYDRGGRVIKESFITAVKHSVSMQYSPAEMLLLAIEDLLEGPDRLHPDMMRKMGELRELRKEFTDARTRADQESFPPVHRRKPPRKGKEFAAPEGKFDTLKSMAMSVTRQSLPIEDFARRHPQVSVAHQDARWWLLSKVDGALVSSADGGGAAWYQRDPERFRSLIQRSVALHTRLLREWPQLRDRYRTAATDFTSPQRWRETFEASRTPGS